MTTQAESLITDEMRAIAETWRSLSWTDTIERGRIRDWCDCIGDPNPLFRDVEYARRQGYPDIPAPPTYFYTYNPFHHGATRPFAGPFKNGFSASDEIITYRPIIAGDTITVTARIDGMWEKQGRPGIGRMLFIRHEYTYTDQNGEVVGKGYWISVNYEGERPQGDKGEK